VRLALKFALSFVIVTILVWGTASYVRIKREIGLFEHDIRRDHQSIGLDLAAAVADIWHLGGEQAARTFIHQANESRGNIWIRLVSLDSTLAAPAEYPQVVATAVTDTASGSICYVLPDSSGHDRLYTIVPVRATANEGMAIELSESLQDKDRYIRMTIWRTVFFTALLGLLAGTIAMLLGLVFIARPVRVLIGKARRIAVGDLSGAVRLNQRDELSELGIELNAMSDRLGEARQQVALESAGRQTALEQLRHADRLTTTGKLASAVAHELGTPLNVIKAHARMIAEGEVAGGEVVTSGQEIVSQSTRMARIIRELLDLSRRRILSKERVDLRLLVQQTAELVATLARKNKVTVSTDAGASPVFATVDIDQIRQVLSNVMVNAVEAMAGGGILQVALSSLAAVQTDRTATPGCPHVLISIADTGPGIAPEIANRLFDPFFTTKESQANTGLGLSISAEIVEEHGGWIEVESNVGSGAKFSIYLPLVVENGKENI